MVHRFCSQGVSFCLLLAVSLAAAAETAPSSAEAQGPVMTRLYWDHSVLRAGREERVWLYLEDRDGMRPALRAELAAPAGVEVLDDAARVIPSSAWVQEPVYIGGHGNSRTVIETYPSTRLSWRVRSAEPFEGVVRVPVSGEGIAVSVALSGVFTEPPPVEQAGYVPEPRVVESERYVGMIACPLWKPGEHYGWHIMERSMPWRKPALGWYDESLPEVTDWEIKWNVEHGVDFFMYCWYRQFGTEGQPVKQMHSHAIHEGLFHARYQDRIKFAIMWTNNDYSGIASRDDLMTNLMPYWVENYFKRSNYLLIDGKPVLAVYDMRRLLKDLGGEEAVSETLDAMRRACVDAGFEGLWLIAESRHWWPDYLERMAACGFDASFAYVWNNVPDGASEEKAHETILSNHQKRIEWNLLPDIPTVSAMWDPSLWERYAQPGRKSAHYHMSPAGFERVCEDVKALTDRLPGNSLARRMVFVDNWNEWGEGHYLAPCREHGFAYLDVIRRVFADAPEDHADLTPEDVGLGPYDAAYRAWVEEMKERNTAREER